jgi:hypothetical protein
MPHLGDQVVQRLPLIDDPFVFHLRCIVSDATQSMLFGEDEIPTRIFSPVMLRDVREAKPIEQWLDECIAKVRFVFEPLIR